MQEATADPLEEFRRVNGEATQLGRPFTADDAPAPLDAYGVSRWRPSRACARLPCKPAWKALLLKRGFMQRIARGEHVTAED
jgi:hypothetical protein